MLALWVKGYAGTEFRIKDWYCHLILLQIVTSVPSRSASNDSAWCLIYTSSSETSVFQLLQSCGSIEQNGFKGIKDSRLRRHSDGTGGSCTLYHLEMCVLPGSLPISQQAHTHTTQRTESLAGCIGSGRGRYRNRFFKLAEIEKNKRTMVVECGARCFMLVVFGRFRRFIRTLYIISLWCGRAESPRLR